MRWALTPCRLAHAQLSERSVRSVEAATPHLLRRGIVRLVAGNALDPDLLAAAGPFDAIHVGAAAPSADMARAPLSAAHLSSLQAAA